MLHDNVKLQNLYRLPEITESMMGCVCCANRSAFSIAAKDRYEAMFLDKSLFPLCRNFTEIGNANLMTPFLL